MDVLHGGEHGNEEHGHGGDQQVLIIVVIIIAILAMNDDYHADHLVIDLMSNSNSTEMSDSSTRGSPMQTSSPPPCLDHTYYSIQVGSNHRN